MKASFLKSLSSCLFGFLATRTINILWSICRVRPLLAVAQKTARSIRLLRSSVEDRKSSAGNWSVRGRIGALPSRSFVLTVRYGMRRSLCVGLLNLSSVALVMALWNSFALAQDVSYPSYNKVYGVATHNSYWINRSDQVDYFASGTQEILTDQLLHDHVRALEIDVHSEGAPAGRWKVYHTSDAEDFSCRYLDDCLEMLRNFHYASPSHDVVNVFIELKNTVPTSGVYDVPTASLLWTNRNFAPGHSIEQFDDIFRTKLGSSLYTPGDFLGRCPSAKTMVECARATGWPSIDQLRGKFIINILGNYSSAAADWVEYANSNLRGRVAFPVQSVFGFINGGCPESTGTTTVSGKEFATKQFTASFEGNPVCIPDITGDGNPSPPIDLKLRESAFEASVFWQLEDVTSESALKSAQQFLASEGIIRPADSYEYGGSPNACTYGNPGDFRCCQTDRIAHGFQFVQTDYPWHIFHDEAPNGTGIPTDPSRRLRDASWLGSGPASDTPYRELGARLYAHTAIPYEVWAYAEVPAVAQRWWETTVSSSRNGATWTTHMHDGLVLDDVLLSCPRRAQDWAEGSIRVSSEDGRDAIIIARQKNASPGASYFQEKVSVYVRVFQGGNKKLDKEFPAARYAPCKSQGDPNSDDVSPICVGSLLGMSVDNHSGGAIAALFSAGRINSDGNPDWQSLGQWSFAQALTRQGFDGSGDVLFAGPRISNALDARGLPGGPIRFLRLDNLPNRQVINTGPAQPAYADPCQGILNAISGLENSLQGLHEQMNGATGSERTLLQSKIKLVGQRIRSEEADLARCRAGGVAHNPPDARIVDLSFFPMPSVSLPFRIQVPASKLWVDTGVALEEGQKFKITSAGKWSNTGPPAIGPAGFAGYLYPGTLLASASLGSLIGKVNDQMFEVGEEFEGTSSSAGTLYLSINDTPATFGDNQGELQVVIWRFPIPHN
jgi:hypothetical protein